MKVIAYCVRHDELSSFQHHAKRLGIRLTTVSEPLSPASVSKAKGHDAIVFLGNCTVNAETLEKVASYGIRFLSSRSAGTNNIDMESIQRLNLQVANVARYSPYAVAEFTLTLTLAILRNLHRSIKRTQVQNYSLSGLIGQELRFKTVGIIGTGRIGLTTAKVFSGLCKKVIAYDIYENSEAHNLVEYRSLDEVFSQSDIIAMHCPYNRENHHIINANSLSLMKEDTILVNTARGELVDTKALVEVLKKRKIGGYAGDVYEKEIGIVHSDHTNTVIPDPLFLGLVNMPNVLFTPHYAFYTDIAVDNMVEFSLQNLHDFYHGKTCENEIIG